MCSGSCSSGQRWSGSADEICSWATHASCPPSRRVVKAQPCVCAAFFGLAEIQDHRVPLS